MSILVSHATNSLADKRIKPNETFELVTYFGLINAVGMMNRSKISHALLSAWLSLRVGGESSVGRGLALARSNLAVQLGSKSVMAVRDGTSACLKGL